MKISKKMEIPKKNENIKKKLKIKKMKISKKNENFKK